jgi:hypothetical protein
MKEKLLFILPDSLEELLFASTVLSQYLISRMVMGRDSTQVTIVTKHEELHSYLKACWELAEIVTEPTREQVEEADFIFEFDAESSYRVTQAVQKHIAEAFSIQLGVGLMRFLPPVLVEDVKEEVGTILVADRNIRDGLGESWEWPHLEDFMGQLGQAEIPVVWLPAEASWEEMRTVVGQASIVVGVRGSATLIAAAANRLVMELSPKDKGHRDWFRKRECATYRMIYGELKDMTPAFVWRQIEKLMEESKRGKPQTTRLATIYG